MDFSIGLSYLILGAMCSWFVIGARGKTFTKMLLITVTTMFSIVIHVSLMSYKGWSTDQALPKDFYVKWTIVQEPYGKDSGSIHMWVKERGEEESKFLFYSEEFGSPRAHALPYSKKMHEVAQKMQDRIKNGESVVGKSSGKKGKDGKQDIKMGEGKETRGLLGSFNFSKERDIEFHVLPRGTVPPK